jgi:pimeloyl-ACP methyl ester carboxylesterase
MVALNHRNNQQVNRAEIPVYFLHGRYDYTVSYTLAKGYFEVFQAPEKAFFTFEHSAHSPHFEEPERVREVLERILKGRVNE